MARAVACVIEEAPWGVYHVTNAGSCSWYEFAREIFACLELDGRRLKAITSAGLKRPAVRPGYPVLANANWRRVMGDELRDWREALRDSLAEIRPHVG